MKRIEKKNLCDTVMNELLSMIEEGVFKEGEQLPNENDLAEQMGVSRTTLREAKNNLVSMNILTKQRGKGTFVVDSHSRQMMQNELDNLNFDQARLVSLYELRAVLEPEIARLAAERASAEELAHINSIQEQLLLSKRDHHKAIELNAAFHNSICEATHNEFLIKVFKNINKAIRDYFDSFGEEKVVTDNSLRYHEMISSFLQIRDGYGASEAMALHLKDFMKDLYYEKEI